MRELRREAISTVPITDPFFNSLREDYPGFDDWLARKSNESAYIFRRDDGTLDGWLYLKSEDGEVTDVVPALGSAKRVKIGTFKVTPHGTRLGERLLKKVFDHAVSLGADEIYVTVFPKHAKLLELFARYGFSRVATKSGPGGVEDVLVRSLRAVVGDVVRDYPLVSPKGVKKYTLAIRPEWHTRLLPDSKLHNEPVDIVADTSHTNSIHKVYLTNMRGTERLRRGDVLVVYRMGDGAGPAHYRSVVTSVCVVEEVRDVSSFASVDELLTYCAPYSVFKEIELRDFFATRRYPTLIRFTYNAALKKRLTRGELIDNKVIDPSAYAGFMPLTDEQFQVILARGGIDAGLVVDQA